MRRAKSLWARGCAVVGCVVVIVLLAGSGQEVFSDDSGPVSFSVNGPVDPHFDGLPVPGTPLWPPLPPVRLGPVPPAMGVPTFRPGDVEDYFTMGFPSEAEIFQSEPDPGPAGPPAGTNNQILQALGIGLVPGLSNVNALTFGEDFFNGDEVPMDGGDVFDLEWGLRDMLPSFVEPTVAPGGLPIVFHFSVDPWAIGLFGTAVDDEATLFGALSIPVGPPGAADVHAPGGPPYGVGPWVSGGGAAGDVFAADPISGPGMNGLDHDEAILALLDDDLDGTTDMDMEDDLDALEHVGDNTVFGMPAEPGNTHDRVAPTMGAFGGFHPPELGDPFNPNHDPIDGNPIIFSVDRGSIGDFGSAVETQVFSGPLEGASGDLFIAVDIAGLPSNMLLIDEGQLGLSFQDDLDAVIVQLLIPIADLEARIALAEGNFDPGFGSIGFGYTEPLLADGEAVVGFSVDTSSFGLVFTAVDFETRVDGLGLPLPFGGFGSGLMEQPGDIFFADMIPPPGQVALDPGTGLPYGTNYLWFEEVDIGLDSGAWSFMAPGPIPPSDLGELPDELNALDSLGMGIPPSCDPDFDGDGDVDVSDFLTFATCFNGALMPPTPICPDLDTDLDGDGDVDVADFLTFAACFNGALMPPAPACPCFGGS